MVNGEWWIEKTVQRSTFKVRRSRLLENYGFTLNNLKVTMGALRGMTMKKKFLVMGD
jgi:hypothetical protein